MGKSVGTAARGRRWEARADGEDDGGGDPFLVIVLLCSAPRREILKCNFNWSEI